MKADSVFEFWMSLIGSEKIKQSGAALKFIELHPGEVLCHQGDTVKGVYLMKSGKLKCFMEPAEGKDRLLHVAVKNDFIGHKAVLLGKNSFLHTWVAWQEALLLFIPTQVFLDALEANPAQLKAVAQKLSASLHETEMNLAGLNLKPVIRRVAHVLLWLDGYFKGAPIPMSRSEFAVIIGTATETAIRMLVSLRRKNLITLRGESMQVVSRIELSHIVNAKKRS